MDLHQKFTLCTLCLDPESKLFDVFEYNERGFKLSFVMQELLQFKVTKQGSIPWMSCTKCIGKLKDFVCFRNNATKSMNILKCLLFDKKQHRGNTWENRSRTCMTNEGDAFEAPPPEEAASIRDANCFSGEVHCSDVHSGEYVMHVKSENEQEIPPAEESHIISHSGELSSFEGVQCSDAHVSLPEQVPLSEELMDRDDLPLYLLSDRSDQTCDAEDHSANITGSETGVPTLSFGDVMGETVDGGEGSVRDMEETPEGETDLKGWIDTGRRFSARLKLRAKKVDTTISLLKEQTLDSPSWNEEIVPNGSLLSTSSTRSSKNINKTNVINGERRLRKEEEAINAGSVLSGPLSKDVVEKKGQGLRCDKCGKMFKCKSLFIKHVKTHCATNDLELIDGGMKSKRRNELQRHKAVSFELNASKKKKQSGVSVEANGEVEDMRKMKRTLHRTCQICHMEFAQKKYLSLHIKSVHLKECNFLCDICRRAFDCKQTLKIHIMSHSREKFYLCSYCEKGFSLSCNLKRHIMSVHKQKKCHTCIVCCKTFYRKFNLHSHMLIHTGERPFTCTICSKTFTFKSALKRHILIHTGERPFTCSICSNTFVHKQNLKSHILTHTGEKPFTCSICSKTFTRKNGLNRHILSHTGERPFTCSICSNTFALKQYLKSHILKHW